jgi:phage terminase small subunit
MPDLKTRIQQHLEKKGTYDPSVDDDMIDDLIENTQFAKRIFKQLIEEGPIVYQYTLPPRGKASLNPLLNGYQMMMRNVYQLAAKLGINRNDRLKLKIIEKKNQDALDALLNEDK